MCQVAYELHLGLFRRFEEQRFMRLLLPLAVFVSKWARDMSPLSVLLPVRDDGGGRLSRSAAGRFRIVRTAAVTPGPA